MRKASALVLVTAVLSLIAAGCSEGTRRDIKHVGEGIKDDVNEGARDLNRKAEDALD